MFTFYLCTSIYIHIISFSFVLFLFSWFYILSIVLNPHGSIGTQLELSYQRSKASCIWLAVFGRSFQQIGIHQIERWDLYQIGTNCGGNVSVPVTVGVIVETWSCGFPFPKTMVKNKFLKVSRKDFFCKISMSTTSLWFYYLCFNVYVHT